MKKKYKSINEEINRIKSLFSEERMFGNLVETDEPVDGCSVGNCINGYGEKEDDGLKYKGNFKNGEWNGYGDYLYKPENYKQKGFFKDGNLSLGTETVDQTEKSGYWVEDVWKRDLTEDETKKLSELADLSVKEAVKAVESSPELQKLQEPQGAPSTEEEPQGAPSTEEEPQGSQGGKTHKVGGVTYDIDLWSDIVGNGGLADKKGDDIDYWVKVNKDGVDYGYRKKYSRIIDDLGADKDRDPDFQTKEVSIDNGNGVIEKWYVPVDTDMNTDATIFDLKDNLKTGKTTLKQTFKECKEKLTEMSKISSKMSLKKYINKENEDPTETYEFCVGKFHSQLNRWDKLRGSKSSINELRDRWFSNIDHERLKVKGGTLGQKYDIMVGSRKLGVVIKKGRDEYRIRTKMGEDIVKQDQGKAEFKNSRARKAVEKAISMPDDKMIVLNKKLISKENRIWASFTLQDRV
jgi:hypothetical protein